MIKSRILVAKAVRRFAKILHANKVTNRGKPFDCIHRMLPTQYETRIILAHNIVPIGDTIIYNTIFVEHPAVYTVCQYLVLIWKPQIQLKQIMQCTSIIFNTLNVLLLSRFIALSAESFPLVPTQTHANILSDSIYRQILTSGHVRRAVPSFANILKLNLW